MNIVVNARHMEVTDAIREHVREKASKLPRYYDNIQQIEVILDHEAAKSVTEVIVTAIRRNTFVATARDDDMYASIDQALHKMIEQLRRHKDKVRDRQGPATNEVAE